MRNLTQIKLQTSIKNKFLIAGAALALLCQPALAEERTIDISGNNNSDDYKSYSTAISIPAGDIVNVKMARYCYFSSTITGSGLLNIYGGGERCYLGADKKTWSNWTNFTGDIHIFPFSENSTSAGAYGVVLANGKSFSPENIDYSKMNTTTEVGSMLQGYYKKSKAAYYLLGFLNTDATLAGTIAPCSYDDNTLLGIIKEGTGTYRITGNNNYLSGALRILDGKVLVMNNRSEAEANGLRGALGAKPNANDAIAYVFSKGVLGGTGSIGGSVDNYGTIEPGADGIGLLTLKNYAAEKDANLTVHPSSRLHFKIASASNYDKLMVAGAVQYSNSLEDFSTSDKMPYIDLTIEQTANIAIGTEFRVLTTNSKGTGDWHFDVRANKYTWVVEEREENGQIVFVVHVKRMVR